MNLNELMKVANSWPIWICAVISVCLIIFQSIFFARLSYKNAEPLGLSGKDCRKAIKTGFVTAIGPSLAAGIVVLSMMSVVGNPITWIRLTMIGGMNTELTAATLGAQTAGAQGLGEAGYDLTAMATSWFAMAINGCGWLVVVILFTHNMDKLRGKVGGGDSRWLNLMSTVSLIGIIGFCMSGYVVSLDAQTIALIGGAVASFIFIKLSEKYKWIKEYSLGFSILAGLIVGWVFL